MSVPSPTVYMHTDIPPGMTCAEYRRELRRPRSEPRLARLGLALLYPVRWLAYAADTPRAGSPAASIYISESANLSHGHGSALP